MPWYYLVGTVMPEPGSVVGGLPQAPTPGEKTLVPPLFAHSSPLTVLESPRTRFADHAIMCDVREHLSELVLALVAGNNAARFLDGQGMSSPDSHFSHQDILPLFVRYKDHEMICVNGTARNEAVPEDTAKFLYGLAHRLVPERIGLVCGGAETGAMGAAIVAFRKAIDQCRDQNGGVWKAEIATVLLKLLGTKASYEKPEDISKWGKASNPQRSWLNRTPALHGLGNQDVLLYTEGGLGTLFEVFYPLSCRQLVSKGIAGVFGETRKPADFIFASSGPSSFWQGTVDQIAEMRECGACKDEHFHTLQVSCSAEEREFAIDLISDLYRKARSQRAAAAMTKPPVTPEALAKAELRRLQTVEVLETLAATALQPRDVSSVVSNPFHALLDNLVAAHRTILHLRETMTRFDLDYPEEAAAYLRKACAESADERDTLLREINRLSDRPAVYLLGSAKLIWNKQLEEYSRELIRLAVRSGVTIVIDGKGTEGMPARWTEMWVDEMKAYSKEHGRRSASELARVQLAIDREEVPARHLDGYGETVFPSVLNVETRTAIAGCIGSKRAVVLAPGGHCEMLAYSQLLLDSQLAGHVDCPYQDYESRPFFQVLNVPGKETRMPYYDGLRRQLDTMVEGRTINAEDFDPKSFNPLFDPKQAARQVIESLRP